jgi:hypothetical protein
MFGRGIHVEEVRKKLKERTAVSRFRKKTREVCADVEKISSGELRCRDATVSRRQRMQTEKQIT